MSKMKRQTLTRTAADGSTEKYCLAGSHWLPASLKHFCSKPDSRDLLHPYCRPCASRLYKEKYCKTPKRVAYIERVNATKKAETQPRLVNDKLLYEKEQMPDVDLDFPDEDDWHENCLDAFMDIADDMSDDVDEDA